MTMCYYFHKGRGKTTLHKAYGDDVKWVIEWPTTHDRMDWRHEMDTLAARLGYNITYDNGAALITDDNNSILRLSPHRRGDWRATFAKMVNAVHDGSLPLPDGCTLESLFPPLGDVPPPAGIDDFCPVPLLKRRREGEDVTMLREIGPVDYMDALRLGIDAVSDKGLGITFGKKKGLTLIECACGRLFIAHRDVLRGTIKLRRPHCGCADGYDGSHKAVMRAAWREYCTMRLLMTTPEAALHKVMTEKGMTMAYTLPPFEDFWPWYMVQSRSTRRHYLQRVDMTLPFDKDNLTLPEHRQLWRDDYNKDRFKVGI